MTSLHQMRASKRPSLRERLTEVLMTTALGAAIGVFATILGLPSLVSYWGGNSPIVLFCAIVGALIGLAAGAPKGRYLAGMALIGLEALYLAVTLSPVSAHLARSLTRTDTPLEAADAVFVFGSSVHDNGELSDMAMSRLLHGLELLSSGQARRLVLSELPPPNRKYSEAAAGLMSRLGIKQELLTVGPVTNSHDEAVAVAKLFKEKGWSKVLAVTSPLHSRRACAALEHEGLRVICTPSAEPRFDLATLDKGDDRLSVFGAAIHERLGLWVYKHRGWIGGR